MAPEQVDHQRYNKKVDIWSIGVILYLFIVGCLPFDSDCEKEIVR